VVVGESLIKTN